jgi:hypothetical protein
MASRDLDERVEIGRLHVEHEIQIERGPKEPVKLHGHPAHDDETDVGSGKSL